MYLIRVALASDLVPPTYRPPALSLSSNSALAALCVLNLNLLLPSRHHSSPTKPISFSQKTLLLRQSPYCCARWLCYPLLLRMYVGKITVRK
jgi:hypothetical protein